LGDDVLESGGCLGLELVILIGLQASGKSTFFCKHLAATHVLVSKDLMGNNRNKSCRQIQLIKNALQAGNLVCSEDFSP
jgi:predicted kinase